MTIKVLVVDDSALIRGVLSEIINAAHDLQLVAAVPDATRASEAIKQFNPDVMTLDVEMPGMNGVDFLETLMRTHPMPVVMISTHTARGSATTLRALELGAVDFVAKPKLDPVGGMRSYANELCEKIRMAFSAQQWVRARKTTSTPPGARLANEVLLDTRTLNDKLIVVGASTGGTEAIKEVLMHLPASMPGILIVQHMPEMFTGPFAKRLDDQCEMRVKEAEHGERVQPGTAYIAPGHSHLLVKRIVGAYICELSQDESNSRHRPAVDVLFSSAARYAGANGLGVILSGMGKDGAAGMLSMRQAGAYNIAQDQQSCVVWGMPREATVNGAAHETAPLHEIAGRILSRLRMPESRTVNV